MQRQKKSLSAGHANLSDSGCLLWGAESIPRHLTGSGSSIHRRNNSASEVSVRQDNCWRCGRSVKKGCRLYFLDRGFSMPWTSEISCDTSPRLFVDKDFFGSVSPNERRNNSPSERSIKLLFCWFFCDGRIGAIGRLFLGSVSCRLRRNKSSSESCATHFSYCWHNFAVAPA